MLLTSTTKTTRRDNDPDLLARVLRCYKRHCKYLTSCAVASGGGQVKASGQFEIGESCYIEDTGHLNAVEVNICFNQILYYAIAMSVREDLVPVFADWTLEEYWARQLPDIMISRFHSTFRRPIDRRSFFGEFELRDVQVRRLPRSASPLIALDTAFHFSDDAGGHANGEVTVAVVSSSQRQKATASPNDRNG